VYTYAKAATWCVSGAADWAPTGTTRALAAMSGTAAAHRSESHDDEEYV